jgi:uncharacterized protein (DUF697 family)
MSWLDALAEIRRRDWSQADARARAQAAREVVEIAAYGGCVAAVVPIPLVDLAILLPVHSAMVMTVGHVYGRSLTQAEAKRVALELGAVAGLSFATSAAFSAIKRVLLPGVGGLLSLPTTFALTTAIGRVSIAYFATPDVSRADLEATFRATLDEAKSWFSVEAFERFRARYAKPAPTDPASATTDAAARSASATSPPEPGPPAAEARPGEVGSDGGARVPADAPPADAPPADAPPADGTPSRRPRRRL